MKLRNLIQVSALFPILLAGAIAIGLMVRAIFGSVYYEQIDVALRLQRQWGEVLDAAHAANDEELTAGLGQMHEILGDCRVISPTVGRLLVDLQRGMIVFQSAMLAGNDGSEQTRSLWSLGRDVQDIVFQLNSAVLEASVEQISELDDFFTVYTGLLGLCLSGIALLIGRELWRRFGLLPQRIGALRAKLREFSASGRIEEMPEEGNDDLTELARAFNSMAKDLNRMRSQLESELQKQTKSAEAARMGSVTLSEALTKVGRARDRVVQEERIHALSQMAEGIGHGLNTALTPLVMMTDFLKTHPDELQKTEKLTEQIEMMAQAALSASQQVEYLTGFFRPEERSLPEAVQLDEVVREAIAMTEPRWKAMAEAHGARIFWETDYGADLPPVAGRREDLIEAAGALILNAVEAMPRGGRVTVQVCKQGETGVVILGDTGTGMDEKMLARCQEPFFTSRDRPGAGMGLTVAATIAKRYGGRMVITSELRKGTQVTFGVPLYSADGAQAAAEDEAEELNVAPGRILVTDDDHWSRSSVETILASAGHEVVTATGGLEAMELLSGGSKFDLIVLDRAMPDMSGDEVALRLGEMEQRPAVLMLTGLADFMEGEQPENVDLVLSKPANVKALLHAVNKLMAASRLLD